MEEYEFSGLDGGDTPDSASRMSALDLYEDLLIEEDKHVENRVYTMQEILEEKRLLEQQNASLLNQVVESQIKIKEMKAEKLALQQHFDSLLATARVELNRKNMLLHQHLDGRANSSHQSASKVVRSKSTGIHFPKKKNLTELYKGKRVPEDELKSTSSSTIISKESESTTRKSVSMKTKDITSSISPMSHKNSVPRDAASRKMVEDSPASITRRNSKPRDQISGGHHHTHFTDLNDQVMTDYCHTEKTHKFKDSSIPPIDHDRNKIDNHSATTDITRLNHTNANSKTVPCSVTVSSFNAKSPNNERRNTNSHSSMLNGLRAVAAGPCQSRSRLPSPPPKSSSLSLFSETTTSHISRGVTRKTPSSRKDSVFKRKDKQSKSTVTKSSSKKQTNHRESLPHLPNTPPKSSFSSSHVNVTEHASGNLSQKEHSPSKDPSFLKVQETEKQSKSIGLESNSKKQFEQRESLSYIPNTPPQSSSFSHSNLKVTSHISGSLMQKVPTSKPAKCSSSLDLKMKNSDEMSKLTMIRSNSTKQLVNRRHSSSKHKKRDKFSRKITGENGKKDNNSQSSLDTSPCDMALQNTDQQSLVTLQSKQHPSDLSRLPINTSVCLPLDMNTSKEEKAPSIIDDVPIPHVVKIKQTDNTRNSSTTFVKTRKLSVASTKSNSSCEEINKKQLVEAQDECSSNKSVDAATVQNVKPSIITSLSTDKPVCYPFDGTNKSMLNQDSAGSNSTVEGNAPSSTDVEQSSCVVTSLAVSKNGEDELKIRSPSHPDLMSTERSAMNSSPMSASIKDGLKLVIKTGVSAEKPSSYCAGKVPANFQPHVCLVDIKSKESPWKNGSSVKTDSKQNEETAAISQPVAVCRKRKFLQQHERDMNSKKQKQSKNHLTNEIGTTAPAASQNHWSLQQENDSVKSVKPTVRSVTISEAEDVNKVSQLKSLRLDATVISCDANKKSPSHDSSCAQHQESATLSENRNVKNTFDSKGSVKAHITPHRSTTISNIPDQKLEGFAPISASTPSSKSSTASCSLNAWLASGQVERQNNNPEKPCPIEVPPASTQNADGNLIHPEITSVGKESVTKQTKCNDNSKSKHYRNAALQWLICLAVEEFKATKAKASRSVWLSSLTKCQERRKQNAKWSS